MKKNRNRPLAWPVHHWSKAQLGDRKDKAGPWQPGSRTKDEGPSCEGPETYQKTWENSWTLEHLLLGTDTWWFVLILLIYEKFHKRFEVGRFSQCKIAALFWGRLGFSASYHHVVGWTLVVLWVEWKISCRLDRSLHEKSDQDLIDRLSKDHSIFIFFSKVPLNHHIPLWSPGLVWK